MFSKFLVRDRYALPPSLQDPVTLRLDHQAATLQISQQEIVLGTYALIDDKQRNISWALQIAANQHGEELQVGEAIFDRPDLLVEEFPCTTSQMIFRIADEGHIGILDISDIGSMLHQRHLGILDAKDIALQRKVVFFFDLMPIVISLERQSWVVKTLRHDESDPFGPWYIIS